MKKCTRCNEVIGADDIYVHFLFCNPLINKSEMWVEFGYSERNPIMSRFKGQFVDVKE